MQGPLPKSNYISTLDTLIIGYYPSQPDVEKLIKDGVKVFVNLVDDVNYKLPKNIKLFHHPIHQGRFLNKHDAHKLAQNITTYLNRGVKVYIHCYGGRGRAGTLASYIYGKINKCDALTSIQAIQSSVKFRTDHSRDFIPIPETNCQVNFLIRELGQNISSVKIKKDLRRDDKSWVRKLKMIRKESLLKNNNKIYFYTNAGEPTFSNYYNLEKNIIMNGMSFPTSEHAYQAMKFLGPKSTQKDKDYAILISKQSTPNKARILALQKIAGGYKWRTELNKYIRRSIEDGVKIREDWDNVKLKIMKKVILEKIKVSKSFRNALTNSGDKEIIEHAHRDKFWADGGNGSGENHLGKILMNIRDEYKSNNLNLVETNDT